MGCLSVEEVTIYQVPLSEINLSEILENYHINNNLTLPDNDKYISEKKTNTDCKILFYHRLLVNFIHAENKLQF